MARYWFKQKRFGFGARPATWEGWALTGVYVALLLAGSAWMAAAPEARALSFTALAIVLTIAFVAISWRTTDGGWRWRWGRD